MQEPIVESYAATWFFPALTHCLIYNQQQYSHFSLSLYREMQRRDHVRPAGATTELPAEDQDEDRSVQLDQHQNRFLVSYLCCPNTKGLRPRHSFLGVVRSVKARFVPCNSSICLLSADLCALSFCGCYSSPPSVVTAIIQMNLHLFIDANDDGGRGVENWNYKCCKTPIKSSPPTNQNRILRSLMPFLSPHQKCRSTYDKLIPLLFIDEPSNN